MKTFKYKELNSFIIIEHQKINGLPQKINGPGYGYRDDLSLLSIKQCIMKKITSYSLILSLAAIVLMSCSKSSDIASWRKSGKKDFLEFKIDGQSYRMEEKQPTSGNSDFITGIAIETGPSEGKYVMKVSFSHSSTKEGIAISLYDHISITNPHYDLKLNDVGIFTFTTSDGNRYCAGSSSYGSIDFTNIDLTLNHRMEATFQMTNMELVDKEGNLISAGHVLSGGRIKTNI